MQIFSYIGLALLSKVEVDVEGGGEGDKVTMKTYENFHNFRVPQPTNTFMALVFIREREPLDKIRARRKMLATGNQSQNEHSPDVTECVRIGI